MTKDEVLALAKECGMSQPYVGVTWMCLEDELLAFANAIADAQREKDAKICEDTDEGFDGVQYHPATHWDCADAIRENKE